MCAGSCFVLLLLWRSGYYQSPSLPNNRAQCIQIIVTIISLSQKYQVFSKYMNSIFPNSSSEKQGGRRVTKNKAEHILDRYIPEHRRLYRKVTLNTQLCYVSVNMGNPNHQVPYYQNFLRLSNANIMKMSKVESNWM